jgi:hypothetical protein
MTNPFAYIDLLAAMRGELVESTGAGFYNYKIAGL